MIVHVITGLGRGGAESALFRLLSIEPNPGRVRVVSLGDDGVFGARLRKAGIEVTCLGVSPRFPSPFKFFRLVRLLREWKPRVAQTWMYHADLFGGLAARLAGIPVCWGLRQSELSARLNTTSTRVAARLCAALSRSLPARVVSCSQLAVESHRAFGYTARFVVIPNGLDVAAWNPEPEQRAAMRRQLNLREDEFVFAHAARAHPQKDHANLARAFSQLHARAGSARLLLCGAGLAESDAYQQALPFSPTARAGLMALGERDDLAQLWQAADAFVLSSSGEAFPNVVVEAMACRLPCVVTDVGDAREIVGDTGLVVPAGDSQALAEAMHAVMKLPARERMALGEAARERVATRYTLERMAAGFRQVWDEVIAEGSSACAD